jgi:hypothetical protein
VPSFIQGLFFVVLCRGGKRQLAQKSRSFYCAYFKKKAAWKTERKESSHACWALRRPMMSFSPTKKEESFLCFCAEKNVIGLFYFKKKGFR